MTIKYYTKQVYGKTMVYLDDYTEARYWNLLSGKKTITDVDMDALTKLTGVDFERVFEDTKR